MLSEACADAVSDGAVSCVVIDAATGLAVAGTIGGEALAAGLLEVLMGKTQVSNIFGDGIGIAAESVEEILVVGPEQAMFACVTTSRRWLVVLVAPVALSVALGWSLLRRLITVAEVVR